jgi:hypothetical protein
VSETNKEWKIGIRVLLTQETDKFSHHLFEIFNVNKFTDKSEAQIQEFLNTIKNLSIGLVRGLKK